ncbi:MAG TPA: glycoside hydrolase family 88 protein [Flavobacterium sp.]|uniref:glycoside hydrolase family 88/105 protein n=1 Tax=unclassified Flavobacterium TaxID=196869 RepID=UPI000E9EB929|nr:MULTISPECIES: glycoside hydrolase family 88 protein [unclassified Flavobacterium]HBI01936.1 glycosyl hydrolase family 88 [Flavobacterium sp.]HRE79064.1 glycoside hydrolase family 88 protein [Flavobacterium sp.]
MEERLKSVRIFFWAIAFAVLLVILFTNCKPASTSSSEKMVVSDKLKWSERMAQTLMKKHPNAFEIDDKTAPKWDYVHGLVMTSFEELYKKTNNQMYYDYLKGYADATISPDGSIPSYSMEKYNIDMIVSGNIMFFLYDKTKEEKYLKAMQTMREQLQNQPRTSEGGFWHKKIYPNQMWLDGLYMGSPFYARYTLKYENGKQLDDVAKQFELIQKNLLDPKTGLLYHGWDESKEMAWANKETGTSPNFWSRSLGWYAMALVDALDYFPENHPKRGELISYLNSLSNTLLKYQHSSGLWYQVTDQGNREGNYLEASGSAMFAYAFAKGVNKGYLPKEFKNHANKAFDGLTRDLIQVTPEGYTILTQACAVAGLGGKPFRDGSYDYYINERKKDNDPKATGPFILAALELNK